MVRKRIIVLGLFIGLLLNQIILHEANMVRSENKSINKTDITAISRPEWFEFCPYGMENVSRDENKYFSENKKRAARINNYWYGRRQDFKMHVSRCDSMANDSGKFICYLKLKERQVKLNNEYKEYLRQEEMLAREREQRAAAISNAFSSAIQQASINQQQAQQRQNEMIMQYIQNRPFNRPKSNYIFYDSYGREVGRMRESLF